MRRKITLYIDGRKADISNDSVLLFNYAFTDVDNPAAVRNSFSKQITLPGTNGNAIIFGNYDRPDRVVASSIGKSGLAFNPLQETPFEIFNDEGNRIESGYLRLDSVVRDGSIVTGYKVTLFGGLGSFFYAMAYNDDGTKKTLASLNYLTGGATELDFSITANQVRSAWTRLASNPGAVTQLWDVLNFAPAYNGQPTGDFSPDKGYGKRTDLGLPTQTGYSADADGYVLVKFSKAMDEWAVKDLRSYLQRPVVHFWAILKAIKTHAATLGYDFDFSDLPQSEYRNLWLTLPLIPSLGTFRSNSGSLNVYRNADWTSQPVLGSYELSGISTFAGVTVKANMNVRIMWSGTAWTGKDKLVNPHRDQASFIFVQLLAYSGNAIVGGSDVYVLGPSDTNYNPESIRNEVGYFPQSTPSAYHYMGIGFDNGYIDDDIEFPQITGVGIDEIRVRVDSYTCEGQFDSGSSYFDISSAINMGSCPTVWGEGQPFTPEEASFFNTMAQEVTYTSPSSFRSGVTVGKAELLATANTPADYLIGFAKMNGMAFLYKPGDKTIKLVKRNSFFTTGEAVMDITDRVDRSKPITITPLFAASRWYELSQKMAEGAFAKEYKDTYGVDYGIQKMDTGYAFNAETKKILENLPFKTAVPSLANGRYWNMVKVSGNIRPSPFIDSDNKYTMWNGSGDAKEFDVTPISPSGSSVTYYNDTFQGYDVQGVSRLELCDKEGKGVDGEDILVRFEGTVKMDYFQLTDDVQLMLNANDGVPCWLITGGTSNGVTIPIFSRYHIVNSMAETILDFGKTREVDVPGIGFRSYSCSIYERRWRAFLADRYNKDTKVLKCRVNLEGLQVGPELLRRFFWYENSLWVLNKITNYSLTTYDTAECEFVQVRDKSNYTNGQTW